jgi:hypothetical protein
MPAPLHLTRYCLTNDAGRFHAADTCLMLYDTTYRARQFAGPGVQVLTVRVTTTEDHHPPCWFTLTRRRWGWFGPVALVELLGMAQAWASRGPAEEKARAAGGRVQAVRIEPAEAAK